MNSVLLPYCYLLPVDMAARTLNNSALLPVLPVLEYARVRVRGGWTLVKLASQIELTVLTREDEMSDGWLSMAARISILTCERGGGDGA